MRTCFVRSRQERNDRLELLLADRSQSRRRWHPRCIRRTGCLRGFLRMTVLKSPASPTDHVQGPDDAPLTLLEYGDYECPYCGLAYPIIKAVRRHFGDLLRFAFRNFPLTQIHPRSESAAEAAEFAGAHGRFWEMYD